MAADRLIGRREWKSPSHWLAGFRR